VQVILLPSATSPRQRRRQYATSYLINAGVAIDAGSLGLHGTPDVQARIKHVFLTHTHIDHLASLPMFLDTAFNTTGEGVKVYGTAEVMDCLRRDIFNDRVWPDLVRLSASRAPYVKLEVIKPGRAIGVDGLELTPVPVNHSLPTVGYVVDDGKSAVVIASDTGATDAIWKRAGKASNWKAAFLEATFPNSLAWLADVAKHHTPASFLVEAQKIPARVRVIAVHLHPRYHGRVARELAGLKLSNVEIVRPGKRYVF